MPTWCRLPNCQPSSPLANVALIFSERFHPAKINWRRSGHNSILPSRPKNRYSCTSAMHIPSSLIVLEDYRSDLTGGVAHCFTGGQAELQRYLELGLHIGITGWICDERRGAELREAVGAIPMNRLLLETDAPYLLPRDIEKKPAARRNEPALLPHILLRLASEMGQDPDLVAAASTENAERLFNLTKADPSP